MDRCRLPFYFNIQSKLPPRRTKRPRDDDPSASESRKIRRGVGHQAALQAVRPCEDNRSSSPPAVQPFQPPQNADHSPAPRNPVEFLVRATPPQRTDGERSPTLTEVNPESGSTTGGAKIWLKGIDFPALFPLFARFGNTVVPTVSIYPCLSISVSSCLLDLLILQPSCVSYTSKHARHDPHHVIEATPIRCAGIWNQHCDVQI